MNKTQEEDQLDWEENNQRGSDMKQILSAVGVAVVVSIIILGVVLLKSRPPEIRGSESSSTRVFEGSDTPVSSEVVGGEQKVASGKESGEGDLPDDNGGLETRTVQFVNQKKVMDRETPGRVRLKILKGQDGQTYVLWNQSDGVGFTGGPEKIQSGKSYTIKGRTSLYRGKKQFTISEFP